MGVFLWTSPHNQLDMCYDLVMKPKLHELVLVTWLDAEEDNQWTGVDEYDRSVLPAKTVGFFVEEKGALFIVARSWDEKNKNTEGRIKLLRRNITKVERLTTGKVLYEKKAK